MDYSRSLAKSRQLLRPSGNALLAKAKSHRNLVWENTIRWWASQSSCGE
jgi:hypothetical protein